MAQDYVPSRRGDYRIWLQHIQTQAPVEAPGFGASAADVSAIVAQTAAQLALMQATESARANLRAAEAAEREGRMATNQLLRRKLG